MNHSPAYIVAQYLIGEGLLSDPSDSGSWPVYVGALPDGPDAPDEAVGAMDTSPVKDGRIMGGNPLFHYGVQLLLRASDYNTGYAKADALASALAAVDDVEVTIESPVAYQLVSVTQTTGVVVVGQEEGTRRREMFSVNFLVTIQEE